MKSTSSLIFFACRSRKKNLRRDRRVEASSQYLLFFPLKEEVSLFDLAAVSGFLMTFSRLYSPLVLGPYANRTLDRPLPLPFRDLGEVFFRAKPPSEGVNRLAKSPFASLQSLQASFCRVVYRSFPVSLFPSCRKAPPLDRVNFFSLTGIPSFFIILFSRFPMDRSSFGPTLEACRWGVTLLPSSSFLPVCRSVVLFLLSRGRLCNLSLICSVERGLFPFPIPLPCYGDNPFPHFPVASPKDDFSSLRRL